MANHSPRTSAQNIPASRPALRCKPGDLVMVVRSRTQALWGRIGVVVCAAADAAHICHADDLQEVMRRDWVIDLNGGPDVFFRDEVAIVTHRLACADKALMPIRGKDAHAIECAEDECLEVSQ